MRKNSIFALILVGCIVLFITLNEHTPKTPVGAIEKMRKKDFVGQVVHEVETEQGRVLFLLRNFDQAQHIDAEYVRKTLNGWMWRDGGGHTISASQGNGEDLWTHQYFPGIKRKGSGTPFPFLFGVIKDDRVDSVNLYSYATKENHRVKVVDLQNGQIKLWYAFITEEYGTKFDLTALTDTNRVISRLSIDDGNF